MPGVFLDFALHARSLLFMNIMEFKSELFHPTKIKIELTSFENFENELFTIFIKNFNTLELTLGTEVNSIVHWWCLYKIPQYLSSKYRIVVS
jgi:hypothetical protein